MMQKKRAVIKPKYIQPYRRSSIAYSVIISSQELGLAEGIETQEQLSMLREMSCDIGQGYYFSRPVPPEQFLTHLSEYQR